MFDRAVNRVNGTWGNHLLSLEDMAKDYETAHGNATLFSIARTAAGNTETISRRSSVSCITKDLSIRPALRPHRQPGRILDAAR